MVRCYGSSRSTKPGQVLVRTINETHNHPMTMLRKRPSLWRPLVPSLFVLALYLLCTPTVTAFAPSLSPTTSSRRSTTARRTIVSVAKSTTRNELQAWQLGSLSPWRHFDDSLRTGTSTSLFALPSVDVEVVRLLSGKAMNMDQSISTDPAVETAVSFLGVGAMVLIGLFVLTPLAFLALVYPFIRKMGDRFVEIYQGTYPDEFEDLSKLSRAQWQSTTTAQLGRLEEDCDYETANEGNFVLMGDLVCNGKTENAEQVCRDLLKKYLLDDDEFAEALSSAVVEAIKEFVSAFDSFIES